jgi:uncharacterized repeat protein (TIGR03803 family)
MNKGMSVGLLTAKPLRALAAVIPFLLACGLSAASAQTYTILHQFGTMTGSDGSEPYFVHLIQASDGDFYGTTEYGGTNTVGTVFKITPTGSLTVLYEFKTNAVNDGEFPEAGVVQGSDGNFYGTAYAGGSNFDGTVFKMTPAGVVTNLHTFTGRPDGSTPFSQLIQGADGFFYGTTSAGGARGYGSVFKIDTTGDLTIVYSFTNGLDGSDPYAGVFQGSDGNFYGTTEYGGSTNCFGEGCGVVYKVTSAGTLTSLHQFGSTTEDGENPIGGIVEGYDGNYYGATFDGGTNGQGTVYRITSAGVLTNLYQFGALAYDGLNPRASLVQKSDGYLYGTTFEGGTNGNAGTLYKIGLTGGLTYVHDFDGVPGDGVFLDASPTEGYDGNLYGTTEMGGTNEEGVVYKVSFPMSQNPNQPNITDTGGPDNGPNSTNNVSFDMRTVAGETYQLQFATALSPSTIWSNVPGGAITNAIGGPLSFTNFVTGIVTQRFYRFQITP